ncbi:MAG TPA: carboxypeptidase regulatory-like domain-containing protein [Kofleriaceae bacterium]|nr:carboxypeptidase regulatory-like domain-containing protein [Kofleriaceae bacterium]
MHRARRLLFAALFVVSLPAAASGCLPGRRGHVEGGALGRVVIYRNGVAFYERNARVEDGRMTVRVPRDKVDDFLKSLTVVESATNRPLAVTIPRREAEDGSYLTMTLETPELSHADVKLTYVTAAPAWKPSYRVVVGQGGKVMFEGWAIVDNTTTEDWNKVKVGVGASSALAFRYDLWSVRHVDRDLLAGEERFAIAPPTGVSPYDEAGGAEELASLAGNELRPGAGAGTDPGASLAGTTSAENVYVTDGLRAPPREGKAAAAPAAGVLGGVITDQKSGAALPGVTVVVSGPALSTEQITLTDERGRYRVENLPAGTYSVNVYYDDTTVQRSNVTVGAAGAGGAAGAAGVASVDLKLPQSPVRGETIVVTGSAPSIDRSSTSSATMVTESYVRSIPITGRTFGTVMGSAAGAAGDAPPAPKPPPPVRQGDDKLALIASKVLKNQRDVVVEVYGRPGAEAALAQRGNAVKNKLVNDGVPAARIRIVPKVDPAHEDNVRVLAVAPGPKQAAAAPPPSVRTGGDTPVGESHFLADRPMTVRAGTSAMVAMVHGETTGGVVYLYDPISERGDARFAFKAVRLENPTSDTLEPGPVTVYGDGRFIGEGITEPVPPRASVVVPFALDKQVVVTREGHDEDRIARLVTVQRGVVTAELQHRRQTRFAVTSRLLQPTTVYLRHRLESGWTLVEAPPAATRVGDSQLFELRLGPGETKHAVVVEATPIERTFDLASPEALGMMAVYIQEPEASPQEKTQLKAQLEALLATHRAAADLVDRLETLRAQLAEYRSRSGELHAQLVTLRAVRTSGELMGALKKKLAEMSERTQKATLEVVDAQEQLMLARVRLQNQLADLRLTDAAAAARR